jgi:hypothetical protein
VRHAEIAFQVLLGVTAFLLADYYHRPSPQAGPSADDRGIVAVEPITPQLHKRREAGLEVIQGVGPARVPRHLHALHGRQVAEDLAAELAQLPFQRDDLALDVELPIGRQLAQMVDLTLKLGDRLLEVEVRGGCHDERSYFARTRRT